MFDYVSWCLSVSKPSAVKYNNGKLNRKWVLCLPLTSAAVSHFFAACIRCLEGKRKLEHMKKKRRKSKYYYSLSALFAAAAASSHMLNSKNFIYSHKFLYQRVTCIEIQILLILDFNDFIMSAFIKTIYIGHIRNTMLW